MQYNLYDLLKTLVEQGGSDLHLSASSPPRIRVDGKMVPLNVEPLSPADAKDLAYGIMRESQKKKFEEKNQIDFAFNAKGLSRFRANVYFQQEAVSAVFRVINSTPPTLKDLNLPSVFSDLTKFANGLVLVTGPTGSGKSTTLAAMVDHINQTQFGHILTIEDPVEYVHTHKNCLINQREIGVDAGDFQLGLKAALRQDPDVILVGELRDYETMAAAISAAETGHLVFGTLHTNGCVSSLNRLIDSFPEESKNQVRTQLSMTLRAVISQTLIPKRGGGRIMAYEMMIANKAVQALVNEGKFNQIYSMMQTGQDKSDMQTLNQHLAALVESKVIELSEAASRAYEREEFEGIVEQMRAGQSRGRR